jgi:hypothetical protein
MSNAAQVYDHPLFALPPENVLLPSPGIYGIAHLLGYRSSLDQTAILKLAVPQIAPGVASLKVSTMVSVNLPS